MDLLYGFLIGFSLGIIPGPVFFMLLQTTLNKGRKAGLSIALGINVADFTSISICILGAAAFFKDSTNNFLIGLAGAGLLIALGTKHIIRPGSSTIPLQSNAVGYMGHFAKGFLINFVNPFTVAVWLTFVAGAGDKFGYDGNKIYIFFGLVISGAITSDLLKVFLADKLKAFLDDKKLKLIFRAIGFILIVFGLRILYHIFTQTA